ncbi:MAG: hypothetical protein DRN29_02235 [Thermoplasmata archaeon]|nr:MAG: hypothetical protein DRN29_02235 [Thermoplasmata archaeon]
MLENIVRRNFREIDKNEEISKIFGYLYGETDFPIIMDGKRPWGIIDERKLIKSKLSGKEKIKDFVVGVPKLDATYSIAKAKNKMIKSGVDKIIVTKEKELLGYVTALDIAKEIGLKGNAESLMREIDAIEEDFEIGETINLMKKQNEKILPVVSNKKFCGVISVKNILKVITTHEKITDYHQEKTSLLAAPVKGYMESGVRTCNPKDDAKKIIEIMEEQGFVIVCKNRNYLGIIEPMDLLRAA